MYRWLWVVLLIPFLAVGGCAWIEARLSPDEELARIAAQKEIIARYKTQLARYEAEREYWRNLIAQVAPDDERRAEWLAREDEAFRRAQYYRDLIIAREPALLAHEERIKAAETPTEVLESLVQLAEEVSPPTHRPIVSLVGGLLLLAWGVYQRTKRKRAEVAFQATAAGIDAAEQDLSAVDAQSLKRRLVEAQAAAKARTTVAQLRGKA